MKDFGMTETFGVVLTGISVVFLALVLLVFVIWLFGKIMDTVNAASQQKKQQAAAPAPKAAPAPPAPQVVEVASDGLSDDIVAAITAAVSAVLAEEGDGKIYEVKSIKRIRNNRRAWGKAAVQENTRPF